jgi:SagB-type dehydrogenase family enzyme
MDYTSPIYHQITSYERRAMEPHALDWRNQPAVYKGYEGIKTFGLADVDSLCAKSLDTVYRSGDQDTFKNNLNPTDLSKILFLAGGLTGRQRQAGQDFYYRSAPSAGALYPNEIYMAWWAGAGLESGIYHFGVHNRRLSLLRPGNFQHILQSAIGDASPDLAAVFMITGIFFRSAWKYRKRAYRYVLLDAGHLMENLRLALNAAEISSALAYDMDDAAIDGLLGVDTQREGILGCVKVYGKGSEKDDAGPEMVDDLPESIRAASRVSAAEIVYPEIAGMHGAGRALRGDASFKVFGSSGEPSFGFSMVMPESWLPLGLELMHSRDDSHADSGADAVPVMDYAEAVVRRRSRRNFVDRPMGRIELFYMLDLLCRAVDKSVSGLEQAYASSVVTGFLAGNVDGVESGFYLLDPDRRRFGRVATGAMTPQMSRVCLDQEWLARAAVHFLFMSRLPDLDARWGARGYRYAMMTAGRLGQVVYLGATAMGLGCCGIGALYDHEARNLLGLNPESALLYLVAAGPVKGFGRHS